MPTQETYFHGESFNVPAGVEQLRVRVRGGPSSDGTEGGVVVGLLAVTNGDTLNFRGSGSGGAGAATSDGGTADAGDGGDYIDVRLNGTTLSDQVAVAAGGGGVGISTGPDQPGGRGGALTGEDGTQTVNEAGKGGTQSAGGAAGTGDVGTATAGARETGGDGAGQTFEAGGGGGGGYYGGGGGDVDGDEGGGGGGGSNYVGGLTTVETNDRGGWASTPEVEVEYADAPNVTLDALTETAEGEVRVQASSSTPYETSGEWRVYRSTDGSQGSLIETDTSDADLDYTDTNAPTGDEVFYTAERVSDFGSDSDQQSIKVRLAAPDNISVSSVSDTSADIDADAVANADEYALYRAERSGTVFADYTEVATSATPSFTDSPIEEGEEFFWRMQARIQSDSAFDSRESAEVSAVTPPTPPTFVSLDDTAQGEITAIVSDTDDSTDGTVELYVSTSSGVLGTKVDEQPAQNTGDYTFVVTGLPAATEHWITARRQTDHASADSTQENQWTRPAAPDQLDVTTNELEATHELTWVDNSGAEAGFDVLEARDGGSQTVIATGLAADTTSYTTDRQDRVSTYEYQVRAFVGSGDARASSLSNTDTASFTTYDNYWATVTPPGGTTETFTAPHVSYVDLEHTAIHGAGVVLGNIDADIANWGPKTDIQLFLDDERIFAGEIIRLREDTPSEGQTDVTAKGPVKELENAGPTGEVAYSDTLAYLAIEDYFTNEITTIDVNATVYTPPETIVENDTLLLSADLSGYDNLVVTDLSDKPVTASGSYLLEESAFIGVEDDFSGAYSPVADSPGTPPFHVSGEYAELGPDDTVRFTVTPQHNIPAERVGIAVRVDPSGSGTASTIQWTFNGENLDGAELLSPDANQWATPASPYSGGDLSAGVSYDMDIDAGDFSLDVDAMVVYDTDYVGGTFSDITSFGETLDNPVPYNPIEIDIENEARPNAVKSARVDSTVSNIGGDFRHRVTVTNETAELTSTSADDTFDFFGNSQYGTIFEPFLRLDGQGSDSVFSSGVNPQEVTKLDYYLTTVDTNVIEDTSLTGSHYDNLRQLHRIAGFNFVTDPRFDPDIDGINIESFLPGSQDSQKPVDWTTIDIDVEREFDGYANAVTVAYEDENGDTQVFNGAPDSAEVSEVGATVRKQIFDTSISTIDEARIRSEREKRKRIARDTTTGEIEAVASFTLPGYSYNISDFGGYTTLDGRVSYRESPDDVTMSLQFKADRDNVQRLLDTQEELEQVKES